MIIFATLNPYQLLKIMKRLNFHPLILIFSSWNSFILTTVYCRSNWHDMLLNLMKLCSKPMKRVIHEKFTMYQWSLLENLFMGGKCTFVIHIKCIASQYNVSRSVWWLSKGQLVISVYFVMLTSLGDSVVASCAGMLPILARHDSDSLCMLLNNVFWS